MQVKHKIVLSSIIYSLGLGALLILLIYSLERLNTIEDTKSVIREVEVSMLSLRRNEKDFLLRKKLKYVNKFQVNKDRIHQNIIKLEKLLNVQNINTEDLKKLHLLMHSY